MQQSWDNDKHKYLICITIHLWLKVKNNIIKNCPLFLKKVKLVCNMQNNF